MVVTVITRQQEVMQNMEVVVVVQKMPQQLLFLVEVQCMVLVVVVRVGLLEQQEIQIRLLVALMGRI